MKRKSRLNSIIQFINTYSILVVLGSFVSYLFFSKLFDVLPNYWVATGFALGVWFIYTLDHLIDGLKLKEKAITVRHKEHFLWNQKIIKLLVIVTLVLGVMAFKVPSSYYAIIALLGLLTTLHFGINYFVPTRVKKLLFLKEVFIAFVVTVGFIVTPLAEFNSLSILNNAKYLFGCFYFINLANLMLFSSYDKEADLQSKTLSIAGFYSDSKLKSLINICLFVSMVFASYSLFQSEIGWQPFTVLCAMILTLLLLTSVPSYFKEGDRYRFYGDLIYLYPLLALPYL
jgi:hypothetical protein